jgi:dolichyl-phosphate-mannose-protein mannosyltransferase
LKLNSTYNFIQVHQEIWSFHQRVKGNEADTHPYCSPWYSWLIMWRPIAYYYAKNGDKIYDVHAMGNPILWWLSTGAIAFLFLRIIFSSVWKFSDRFNSTIVVYLLCNYLANLLPWIKVGRCTFLYHYMAAYVFTWIALAWILSEGWRSSSVRYQIASKVAIVLIIFAFLYWLPIYLGIPLSISDYYHRMMLPSWI